MTDLHDLLGGAVRGRTRERGFAPWNPRPNTLVLLDQCRAVLGEYEDYLPLTIRQIFYRLVGAHSFDKTERAYARLCETMNRARRARLIDMDVIRDGGGAREQPDAWLSGDQFLDAVRRQAGHLRLDRKDGQPTRLVVMCEAAGMVPQLAHVVDRYGIAVISSGGFESVTEKHAFAAELADDDQPTEILHIGDHDPSGAHLFLALAEDVQAFAADLGGDVSFTRLAVTPAQITTLGLETAPPKATDSRAFTGETCQAEAIPPDVLAQIVRDAVESRLDHDAYERVLEREREEQRRLVHILNGGSAA
jgi:hypothetical protein